MPRTDAADHVTLTQQMYAAFANRDVGTLLSALAADVEWSEPDNPLNPSAGTRRGHSGVLDWLRIGNASEEILVLEPTRFIAGDDVVVVLGHMKCRARTTARTYESDFVHVVGFRNGQISRFQEFFDTYAAAEAFRVSSS
jgi:ketosteroid isomerase-like protein